MSSATGSSKVPAWKKLGLKLKQPGAASDASPASASASASAPGNAPRGGPVGHHSQGGQTPKRKFDAPPAAADDSLVGQGHGAKRPRRDDDRNASARKHKSVSFGDTPTKADLQKPSSHSSSTPTTTPSKSNLKPHHQQKTTTPKKSKGPAKKEKPQPPVDLKSSLEYLRQWKSSRDKWKFNKNHQSQLIKHVFDADGIPASDITTFYEYIRDLKGFVRQRLREEAMEVKVRDQTLGAKGFPDGTKDVAAKQTTYEAMLQDFFGPPPGSNKRKLFDEAEYLASSPDADFIIRRVIKRFRAELILDELADDGTDISTTTTSTAASEDTITGSENTVTNAEDETQKKINTNMTGKRRRKLRTQMDDSDSSSSSESESDDSDSDSSSDDSSSDESDDDDDDEIPAATTGNGYDSDSSSSSSSSDDDSDDSDSDSEAESEAEK